MISAPGAAMLDDKLFVCRDDNPYPDLYERWWDGVEWVWVNHGRPGGERVRYAPGAAMSQEKLFVVSETGSVWERHWRADLGRWVWQDHGRPNNEKVVASPGAAMGNEKFFVTTETGSVWERHWRADLGRWAWHDHGRPGNQKVIASPGAAMGADKFFVTTDTGALWERHWRPDLGRWAWQDHGRPPGSTAATSPGAAMMGSKLFVGGGNAHLFERVWGGTRWDWVDHGTAYHDTGQHVIGTPTTEPAIVIAIMGDGYDEAGMDDYRRLVDTEVAAAFRLDQLAGHAGRLQVIRIDVASPVAGVWEQDWDQQGTTGDETDDTLVGEQFRASRLGMVSTAVWARCWLVPTDVTNPRITSIRNRFAPAATNVVVVVNSAKFGGCNRGDMAAFTRTTGKHVIAHEMGHNLFALGDEYNNDTLAFTGTTTRVNLSEHPGDWSTLRWRDLVGAGTPLPTDAGALPGGWDRRTSVGAFEGGGGNFGSGIFRPVLECRMNQNNPAWCPVCAREIDNVFGAL